MTRRWVPAWPALALVLLATPAAAEPVLARYEVRAGGLPVMQIEALLDLGGTRYLMRLRLRSSGVLGLLAGGDQVTLAEGAWHGSEPVPVRYRLEGQWQGTPRQVALDYAGPGQPPLLRAIEPPIESWREPVPEPLRRGTVDSLSAIAKLSRVVARTGRCDTGAPVFDGRRRVDYAARTDGTEHLPPEGAFAGPALRCAFEARVIAGVRGDQDPDEARRPQPATAWLAEALPGRPPLPVRIELPSRWWGRIRVVLTAIEPAPPSRAVPPSGQELAQQRR